jgi:hypothetical protein
MFINRDTIAESVAVEKTISQLTSPSVAAVVGIALAAACAHVFSALIPAFFHHSGLIKFLI